MKKARIIEILVTVAVLIIGFFCIKAAFYRIYIKPNLYTITFSDIDSIIKGSPVRFMGIIVGHVEELTRKEDKIVCKILITKSNTKIPDGALAKVEFNGLAGSKSVEIMPPKTNDPEAKGIVTVETRRISDFMQAAENIREVGLCIKELVDGITPESSLSAAKTISNLKDTSEIDKTLDKTATEQNKRKTRFNKNIKQIQSLVDGFNKEIKK